MIYLKNIFLLSLAFLHFANSYAQKKKEVAIIKTDRQIWLDYLDKVARPVMSNLAADQLKEKMPVGLSKRIDNAASRSKVAYLEAFGRTLAGIAPWLNSDSGSAEEIKLRNQYRAWTLKAIANSVNPTAKDFMQWNGGQPLVDASFVAAGLVRCPWLWQNLDTTVRRQVVDAFIVTRSTVPVYSNWLLFSGMIETFFCKYDLPYDAMRIDYAVREFSQHWYTGDGMFSDGMQFHLDYYNSYVIQPFLAAILEVISKKKNTYNFFVPQFDKISKRYAEIQERLVNSDGSFPLLGRSIIYRGGAFHHLADVALRKQLPASLKPAQVRGALTAIIKKTLQSSANFDSNGWLNIGLSGNQPDLADVYNTTGSLYLCTFIFLPLGLADTEEFWSAAPEPWTSVKAWSGQDAPADHALDIRF